MKVGNLLHKWNVENDQACSKSLTSFQLVRLVGCGLKEAMFFEHLNVSLKLRGVMNDVCFLPVTSSVRRLYEPPTHHWIVNVRCNIAVYKQTKLVTSVQI